MNRKGAEYVCTPNANRHALLPPPPPSPLLFFARCQPRSTSFSSGKIAICNWANLSNRLTTSLCRKRGAANRRIDGIVMNDSRAQPPILPGHPRASPRWYRSPTLAVPRSEGSRLSHRGIHDHPERFHRIRACRAFLSFFPPFFSLTFSRGLALKSMEALLSCSRARSSPFCRSFFSSSLPSLFFFFYSYTCERA